MRALRDAETSCKEVWNQLEATQRGTLFMKTNQAFDKAMGVAKALNPALTSPTKCFSETFPLAKMRTRSQDLPRTHSPERSGVATKRNLNKTKATPLSKRFGVNTHKKARIPEAPDTSIMETTDLELRAEQGRSGAASIGDDQGQGTRSQPEERDNDQPSTTFTNGDQGRGEQPQQSGQENGQSGTTSVNENQGHRPLPPLIPRGEPSTSQVQVPTTPIDFRR